MNIDHTISFRQDMIDLILAGKKTVTIRPIKPQLELIEEYDGLFLKTSTHWSNEDLSEKGREWLLKQYPHGQIGDFMAIRERPDLWLTITGIAVDRLHHIDRDTWIKDHEKFNVFRSFFLQDDAFCHWTSFYSSQSEFGWYANPWVWIIEFELEKKG